MYERSDLVTILPVIRVTLSVSNCREDDNARIDFSKSETLLFCLGERQLVD